MAGSRLVFSLIEPNWPLPNSTVPVLGLSDARLASWVTYCSICASTMPRAQNRAAKGSIILWRRLALPIWVYNLSMPQMKQLLQLSWWAQQHSHLKCSMKLNKIGKCCKAPTLTKRKRKMTTGVFCSVWMGPHGYFLKILNTHPNRKKAKRIKWNFLVRTGRSLLYCTVYNSHYYRLLKIS